MDMLLGTINLAPYSNLSTGAPSVKVILHSENWLTLAIYFIDIGDSLVGVVTRSVKLSHLSRESLLLS